MSELLTLLGDRTAGLLERDRNGRVSFTYDDAWRAAPGAYPLSLSMPLTASRHGHATVDAFLWGLLPDNERILERWARQFHVSARSAFGLLGHVGQDCAGAVRFASLEATKGLVREGEGAVDWLDERQVADRLRALRRDHGAWRAPEDVGQFSLAGAQPKTALLFDGRRWGVPSGRRATTHILKPGAPDLAGHAENEHFCLTLARELGLPTASSRVARFEDEVAIVVERYDRARRGTQVLRVHQEDACQALAVHPERKYESDGGPGVAGVVALLRASSAEQDEDVQTFVDSVAFNWLVAGTDAHAKNYSLLIGDGGRVRLAPLYDVASALPYQPAALHKTKLAMKIGGKYRIREIGRPEWVKLADAVGLDPTVTVARIATTAEAMPEVASTVATQMRDEGVSHGVLDRLVAGLTARARSCAMSLG